MESSPISEEPDPLQVADRNCLPVQSNGDLAEMLACGEHAVAVGHFRDTEHPIGG